MGSSFGNLSGEDLDMSEHSTNHSVSKYQSGTSFPESFPYPKQSRSSIILILNIGIVFESLIYNTVLLQSFLNEATL